MGSDIAKRKVVLWNEPTVPNWVESGDREIFSEENKYYSVYLWFGGVDKMDDTIKVLSTVTCPSCWHKFSPADCVYISKHESLLGDPIVGEDAQMRFMPSKFSTSCMAIDPAEMECHLVACPRCHIEISRASLELEPIFLSVVGAPASGKSFLLGSMTWTLRKTLTDFNYRFIDADPTANQTIHSYEQTLFLAENQDDPVTIRKTEVDGSDLYRSIRFGSQEQRLPKPFLFTIDSQKESSSSQDDCRLLVLYDNAGEHFLPGSDKVGAPVTEHLAKSAAILFVYDVTQDPRLRKFCQKNDPQIQHGSLSSAGATATRQETILSEAASRVRKHLGISSKKLHHRPLVVVLGKADAWIHNIPEINLNEEPFIENSSGQKILDIEKIDTTSHLCEKWLHEHCPEFIAAARGFCDEITYIPVSATGCSPELVGGEDSKFYGVRPSKIDPQWITVPFMFLIRNIVTP